MQATLLVFAVSLVGCHASAGGECPHVQAGGPAALVAIVAPSVDEIYRLDLPHVPGLSLLDHPEAKRTADGRVAVAAYVTDEGRAALCVRGCTASRGCEILTW